MGRFSQLQTSCSRQILGVSKSFVQFHHIATCFLLCPKLTKKRSKLGEQQLTLIFAGYGGDTSLLWCFLSFQLKRESQGTTSLEEKVLVRLRKGSNRRKWLSQSSSAVNKNGGQPFTPAACSSFPCKPCANFVGEPLDCFFFWQKILFSATLKVCLRAFIVNSHASRADHTTCIGDTQLCFFVTVL